MRHIDSVLGGWVISSAACGAAREEVCARPELGDRRSRHGKCGRRSCTYCPVGGLAQGRFWQCPRDSQVLPEVLSATVVKRTPTLLRRRQHLCADAGYRGADSLRTIEAHGDIPHVVDRRKEADSKRRDPTQKARRWVVEVCHSRFKLAQTARPLRKARTQLRCAPPSGRSDHRLSEDPAEGRHVLFKGRFLAALHRASAGGVAQSGTPPHQSRSEWRARPEPTAGSHRRPSRFISACASNGARTFTSLSK